MMVKDVELLEKYLISDSAHQIFLASVILQEWAVAEDEDSPEKLQCLGKDIEEMANLVEILIRFIESPPPATYREMTVMLNKIHTECHALLNAFTVEGKISKDKIPTLPNKVDPLSQSINVFSLATSHHATGEQFDALVQMLSKNGNKSVLKTVLPSLEDRRRKVMSSIGHYSMMKERYDVQVSAAVAGALIALRVMPSKFGPVIKSVMDGIKVCSSGPMNVIADDPIERRE